MPRPDGANYRRMGERESAQKYLAIATMMYCEMDMRSWLDQAEAEMRQLAGTGSPTV
jgi:hypothetical protein